MQGSGDVALTLAFPGGGNRIAALFTENYTEQLTWREAASGRILAASDYFEPLSINGLTPPGFGGRIYFPTAVGKGFYVLQVMPRPSP